MLNLRSKSVNVSRLALLDALVKNLETHKTQYQEAIADYKTKLRLDANELVESLEKDLSEKDLKKLRIEFNPPSDHSKEYTDAIEMLEMSVDDTIQLDEQSFKAFIKNQWLWSDSFNEFLTSTKSYISGKTS